MRSLDLVRLTPLMRQQRRGARSVPVGLIDGPVDIRNPDLSERTLSAVGALDPRCRNASAVACRHGTEIASMLARISPESSLLIRPIFFDEIGAAEVPRASADELAIAILECVAAGARVLNISAGLTPSLRAERRLGDALSHVAARDALVVAAAGNEASLGSSAITRHPAVIPVAACDLVGAPLPRSNLGRSIARAGLLAPGVSEWGTVTGTSAAAPYVAGALALLWAEFPALRAEELRFAIVQSARGPRRSVAPRLLDAWAAFRMLGGRAGSIAA